MYLKTKKYRKFCLKYKKNIWNILIQLNVVFFKLDHEAKQVWYHPPQVGQTNYFYSILEHDCYYYNNSRLIQSQHNITS